MKKKSILKKGNNSEENILRTEPVTIRKKIYSEMGDNSEVAILQKETT